MPPGPSGRRLRNVCSARVTQRNLGPAPFLFLIPLRLPVLLRTPAPPVSRISGHRSLHVAVADAPVASFFSSSEAGRHPRSTGRLLRLPRLRALALALAPGQVTTAPALAGLAAGALRRRYLPGERFWRAPTALRLRPPHRLLYGDPAASRSTLTSTDLASLPLNRRPLMARLREILADLAQPISPAGSRGTPRRTGGSGKFAKLTSRPAGRPKNRQAGPSCGTRRFKPTYSAVSLSRLPTVKQWLAVRPPLPGRTTCFCSRDLNLVQAAGIGSIAADYGRISPPGFGGR